MRRKITTNPFVVLEGVIAYVDPMAHPLDYFTNLHDRGEHEFPTGVFKFPTRLAKLSKVCTYLLLV